MEFNEPDKLKSLISKTRLGENGAFAELVEMYTPLINKLVSGFIGPSILYSEAFSEACIALHKAAVSYNLESTDVTFGLYARICIRRKLLDLVSRVSRDANLLGQEGEIFDTECDVETTLIVRESMERYLKAVRAILSEYEYNVLTLYIDGRTTAEISETLGKDAKSVDNAKARIFRRLREKSDKISAFDR